MCMSVCTCTAGHIDHALWNNVLTIKCSLAPTAMNTHDSPVTQNYSKQGIAEMDTADALGDFFFSGRSVCKPIECAINPHEHDCTNPEVTSDDLTVTKVFADLGDPSAWGEYARCNIGPPGAPPGVYACECGGHGAPIEPCNGTVGNENVAEHFGNEIPSPNAPNYMFWRRNLAIKTQGQWYSTPASGEGSKWKILQTVKQINKTCADNVMLNIITTKNPSCFSACPQPTNTSSTCFITCWYDTVIGPQSGSTLISNTSLPTGATILSRDELQQAYEAPFDQCPAV
eukprot:m.106872 g.106872  ORF g.106872 m.106872 type:complete len:286 (+) comp10603_c0_seq2:70-927(+)